VKGGRAIILRNLNPKDHEGESKYGEISSDPGKVQAREGHLAEGHPGVAL